MQTQYNLTTLVRILTDKPLSYCMLSSKQFTRILQESFLHYMDM